jgi:Dolichyl-phosphate-mannose-protein mannosyltransferase
MQTSRTRVWLPGQRVPVSTIYSERLDRLETWIIQNASWLALAIVIGAFAIRLVYCSSCYINPDEAEHFGAARPSTWLETYAASRMLAHPPLFILVLHGILLLGRTEVLLRLPSLIGGTVALWLAFAWMRRSLGEIPSLAGLGFMALSPAAITASTEARQYGLLLCFVCGALYATERTFSERSSRWAAVQGLFLLGALLTHYTTIVVLLSLGFYVLIRLIRGNVPRHTVVTIGISQLVLATVLGWLFFGHIRRSIVFSSGGGLDYLRHYYYAQGSETPLGFAWRAFSRTFYYAVGSRPLALVFLLVFLAGVAALLAGRTRTSSLMALLVIAPFVVGFAVAVAHVFPFAGSRHQTYLLPFLAGGIAAALTWLRRAQAVSVLLLGVVVAPFWAAHAAPENNMKEMPLRDMTATIEYLDRMVPRGSRLFVDDETRDVLRYYLARYDTRLDTLRSNTGEELLGGYRVVEPRMPSPMAFRPDEVVEQVTQSARELGVPYGDPLWIISAAWKGSSLASRLPALEDLNVKEFGRITVIGLRYSKSIYHAH